MSNDGQLDSQREQEILKAEQETYPPSREVAELSYIRDYEAFLREVDRAG